MALDKCMWEVAKPFAFYKLEHIFSFCLNTNAAGNEIELVIYKVDEFSH